MEKPTKRILIFILFPVLLLLAAGLIADRKIIKDPNLHVYFYALNGESTLIRTPGGNKVLIDGGSDDEILPKLGEELPFYDRTIDLVVLTSPMNDRVSGLVEVLKRYHVKEIIMPDIKYSSRAFSALLDEINNQHIQKIFAQQGQRIWLDNETALDIYEPLSGEIDAAQASDAGDEGISARLSFGQIKIFFAGSISSANELNLQEQFDLSSDVLVVSTDNGKETISDGFLKAINPKYLIVEGKPDNLSVTLDSKSTTQINLSDGKDLDLVSDGTKLDIQ